MNASGRIGAVDENMHVTPDRPFLAPPAAGRRREALTPPKARYDRALLALADRRCAGVLSERSRARRSLPRRSGSCCKARRVGNRLATVRIGGFENGAQRSRSAVAPICLPSARPAAGMTLASLTDSAKAACSCGSSLYCGTEIWLLIFEFPFLARGARSAFQ